MLLNNDEMQVVPVLTQYVWMLFSTASAAAATPVVDAVSIASQATVPVNSAADVTRKFQDLLCFALGWQLFNNFV